MITYISKENAQKYSQLFSEANQALIRKWIGEGKDPTDPNYFGPLIEDPETGDRYYTNEISSLNSYFSWINDLLNITELPILGDNNAVVPGKIEDFDGMRFSMLPIDEDVFSINANTRDISVPKSFADNGISVCGDEISEVIYFKINRFFDATDLFNQDVMIEWIAPSGLKGYSVPTVKVLDETTNYVIFGWALASAITAKAGNVTFSVRFYKYDGDSNKIQYSLSTKTQTAKILPNINLDIAGLLGSDGVMDGYKVLGDEIKALIKERSENSNFGADGDRAEPPRLLELDVDIDNSHKPYVVLLGHSDDLGYYANVSGLGYSIDGGTVSYFWKKFTYDGNERIQSNVEDENSIARKTVVKEVPITREKAIQLKEQTDNNVVIYQKINDKYEVVNDIASLPASITTLYKKISVCTFDGPGCYRLVIKNRSGKASKETSSDYIVVYPPNMPVIDPEGKGIYTAFLDGEEDGSAQEIKVLSKIYDRPDNPPAFATGNASQEMKDMYFQKDGETYESEKGIEYHLPLEKYGFDSKNENILYEWHFKPLAGGEEETVEGGDKASLTPAKEGDYYCALKGSLNGVETKPVMSKDYRVTYKPAEVIYAIEGTDAANGTKAAVINEPNFQFKSEDEDISAAYVSLGRDEPITLTYRLDSILGKADHQLSDKLSGTWYRYELKENQLPAREDALAAKQGKYVPASKASIQWLIDTQAVEEDGSFKFTIEELNEKMNAAGDLSNPSKVFIKLGEYKPQKDGFYFCYISNEYNGKVSALSTPLAYYDSVND